MPDKRGVGTLCRALVVLYVGRPAADSITPPPSSPPRSCVSHHFVFTFYPVIFISIFLAPPRLISFIYFYLIFLSHFYIFYPFIFYPFIFYLSLAFISLSYINLLFILKLISYI